MAICVSMLFGRLGTALSTNIIGFLLETSCELTYYIFSGIVLLCFTVSFVLPSWDELKQYFQAPGFPFPFFSSQYWVVDLHLFKRSCNTSCERKRRKMWGDITVTLLFNIRINRRFQHKPTHKPFFSFIKLLMACNQQHGQRIKEAHKKWTLLERTFIAVNFDCSLASLLNFLPFRRLSLECAFMNESPTFTLSFW